MSAFRNRFLIKFLLAAAVLAAAALLLVRALRPVAVVEPVVSGKAIDAKPGNVTVEEEYAMELRNQLGGRILADGFALAPGDRLKEGQIVARLDSRELQVAIDENQSLYDTTQEQYKTDHSKELTLKSMEAALANHRLENKAGSISDSDLAAEETTVAISRQSIELEKIARKQALTSLENTLKTQRLQLDQMTLRAPADMVVKAVNYHPGDVVGALSPIATLISLRKHVVGKISDEDFAKIKEGQPVSVFFVPYGDFLFNGKVAKILPTTDPLTQRHNVYLEISDIPDEKLIPGINGEVTVTVDEHSAAAIVPRRAVFSVDGDNVFVVRDGRVELRKVTKGFAWSRGIEITAGLKPGEKVIVEGTESFHDGESVSVEEHPSDAVAPAK